MTNEIKIKDAELMTDAQLYGIAGGTDDEKINHEDIALYLKDDIDNILITYNQIEKNGQQ